MRDNMGKLGGAARSVSGAWGRLKPASESELDSIGLPSKGDNRLLDYKTQERYYAKIVERYLKFCADGGRGDELLQRMAALDISDTPPPNAGASSAKPSFFRPASSDKSLHMSDILFALRKLREGIVASNRVDQFSAMTYMFCIRTAVLARHPPTYFPAILYAMRRFQPAGLLSSLEIKEVATYLVLDAACRKQNLAEAYMLRGKHGPINDDQLDAMLSALAHDDYVAFRRLRAAVDGYQAMLMDFMDQEMRMRTLKTFGRAYLGVDLPFLEKWTGQNWLALKEGGVGWELHDDKVVIRKVKQPVASSSG